MGGKRGSSSGNAGNGKKNKAANTPTTRKGGKSNQQGVHSLFGSIAVKSGGGGGKKQSSSQYHAEPPGHGKKSPNNKATAPGPKKKAKPSHKPSLQQHPGHRFAGARPNNNNSNNSASFQPKNHQKSKKGGVQRPPPQLQLPPTIKLHNRQRPPLPLWLVQQKQPPRAVVATATTPAPAVTKKRRNAPRLPVDDIPTAVLDRFDWELAHFGTTVRLSEPERWARQHCVEQLQQMAAQQFGSAATVQVFGSFATPEVCTYASDVDCAVWGAVPAAAEPPPKQLQAPKRNANINANLPNKELQQQPQQQQRLTELQQQRTADDRKKALMQKWQVALEAAAPPPKDGESTAEPASKKIKTSNAADAKASPSALFVIDRVGDGAAQKLDTTRDTAICVEDEVVAVDIGQFSDHDSDDDDENGEDDKASSSSSMDSADKLAELLDSQERQLTGESRKRPSSSATTAVAAAHTVSLLSSSSVSSSEGGDDDGHDLEHESELEISIVTTAHTSGGSGLPKRAKTMGPTGRTRHQVVDALVALSRKLRKSDWTQSVLVIKNARVPIVKMETSLGFEADIAIGGHNGADTSHYAAIQVENFQSFATVVLVLKILLAQNDLDQPFTGGLGSYKLYVLVAHHLQQYLELGGTDRPSEILISFLFRYGGIKGHNVDPRARTKLSQYVPLVDNSGCMADLSNVFQLQHCVQLFKGCWTRLWKVTRSFDDSGDSLLMHVVDAARLQRQREASLRKAEMSVNRLKRSGVSIGRSSSTTASSAAETTSRPVAKTAAVAKLTNSLAPQDRSAEQLMAGYGVSGLPPLSF